MLGIQINWFQGTTSDAIKECRDSSSWKRKMPWSELCVLFKERKKTISIQPMKYYIHEIAI